VSRRVLILLLFAALILAADWHTPALDTQPSAYSLVAGRLIRNKNSSAGQGIQLVAEMPCADTPPELAAFFNLALPVNRADQAALLRLPGIGPKLAESILTYRAGQGGFAGPDDLRKVKGIGPKRSARLLPLLCFDQAR
jgi:competence protein ComEA